ncbi:hypothetical protein B0H11DRAFT_2266736 [Mycena galericulata]|nr:hypothetical protein B0H11DRAFT_2266736 [Mycena galericulata]
MGESRYPVFRYFPRRVNLITHFQSCTSRLYAPEITYRRDLGEVWTVENGKFDGIHIDWQAKEEAIEGYPGAHAALHKSVELALQHLAARCEAGHHLTCQLRVKEEMCPSTVADDLGDLHCVDGDVDAYYALRAMKGGDGLYMVHRSPACGVASPCPALPPALSPPPHAHSPPLRPIDPIKTDSSSRTSRTMSASDMRMAGSAAAPLTLHITQFPKPIVTLSRDRLRPLPRRRSRII